MKWNLLNICASTWLSRKNSSIQPSDRSRVRVPDFWTGRRAKICIYSCKKTGELGKMVSRSLILHLRNHNLDFFFLKCDVITKVYLHRELSLMVTDGLRKLETSADSTLTTRWWFCFCLKAHAVVLIPQMTCWGRISSISCVLLLTVLLSDRQPLSEIDRKHC